MDSACATLPLVTSHPGVQNDDDNEDELDMDLLARHPRHDGLPNGLVTHKEIQAGTRR